MLDEGHREHKRKEGHKPSLTCYACWLEWLEETPNDRVITVGELRRILQAMSYETEIYKLDIMWKDHR